MNRDGKYPVVFFINLVPLACLGPDVFYDGGSEQLNRFYLDLLGDGTPAISTYDAFRHLRPSQMPLASGHAIGNSNVVKAGVLFQYLQREVFPRLTDVRFPGRGRVLQTSPAQRRQVSR